MKKLLIGTFVLVSLLGQVAQADAISRKTVAKGVAITAAVALTGGIAAYALGAFTAGATVVGTVAATAIPTFDYSVIGHVSRYIYYMERFGPIFPKCMFDNLCISLVEG